MNIGGEVVAGKGGKRDVKVGCWPPAPYVADSQILQFLSMVKFAYQDDIIGNMDIGGEDGNHQLPKLNANKQPEIMVLLYCITTGLGNITEQGGSCLETI